jgi:hypothetical protein
MQSEVLKVKLPKLLVGFIILSILSFNMVRAEASAPGTADDPVITKSYFDQNSLTEEKVKQIVTSVIANQSAGGTNSNGSEGSGSNNASSNGQAINTDPITVVQLKTGQTLYAGSGAEFIVRTGKTVAVSNDEDGIPDVTAGKDIAEGAAIGNNHLLVFPKDTRGVKPAPKNTEDIYIMVRGSYQLLNADGSKVTP